MLHLISSSVTYAYVEIPAHVSLWRLHFSIPFMIHCEVFEPE